MLERSMRIALPTDSACCATQGFCRLKREPGRGPPQPGPPGQADLDGAADLANLERGLGAVAGPRATEPSATRNTLPCQGQAGSHRRARRPTAARTCDCTGRPARGPCRPTGRPRPGPPPPLAHRLALGQVRRGHEGMPAGLDQVRDLFGVVGPARQAEEIWPPSRPLAEAAARPASRRAPAQPRSAG